MCAMARSISLRMQMMGRLCEFLSDFESDLEGRGHEG